MKAVIFDFSRTLYDPVKNRLTEGALNLLENLKNQNIKMAIIANSDKKRTELLKTLNIYAYFEKIIFKKGKSSTDYLEMAATLNISPKDIIVIGDRTKKEIKYGNLIGATTVWFRNSKYKDELPRNKEETPDYTIDNLNDFTKRFTKLSSSFHNP